MVVFWAVQGVNSSSLRDGDVVLCWWTLLSLLYHIHPSHLQLQLKKIHLYFTVCQRISVHGLGGGGGFIEIIILIDSRWVKYVLN